MALLSSLVIFGMVFYNCIHIDEAHPSPANDYIYNYRGETEYENKDRRQNEIAASYFNYAKPRYQYGYYPQYNTNSQGYQQDLLRRTKDYTGNAASGPVFRATLNHFYEHDRAVNADTEAQTASYAAHSRAYAAALHRY